LSNSNSIEKDYIILGRWVYNNIEYDLKYTSEKWTVEQILEKKVGVCSDKTRLYNAFLNCINIDSIYVKGFFQSGNDNNVNLDNTHGWTLAKIDGKWVPLDATNNIFNGRLPSGFIFRYYGDYYRNTDVDWRLFGDKSSNIKNENKFSIKLKSNINFKNKSIIIFFKRIRG
jgi:transglutaminase-like putative cysteine protease